MAFLNEPPANASGPRRKPGLNTPARLLLLLFVSLTFFALSIPYGFHTAHRCTVDAPQNSRCGFDAMKVWIIGLAGGLGILVVGGIVILSVSLKHRDDIDPPKIP